MHDVETYYAERRLDDVAQFDTLQDTVYHDIVNRMTNNSDEITREYVQDMITSMDSDSVFMRALVDLLTVYRDTSVYNQMITTNNLRSAYLLFVEQHADNIKFAEAQNALRAQKNETMENMGIYDSST